MAVRERITYDEFDDFIARRENAERLFELINGEIVEKMPTLQHGFVAALIGALLNLYLLKHDIGNVYVEGRYRVQNDRYNDRLPDVSFVAYANDKPMVVEGAAPFIPDLAVEIRSPGDSAKVMAEKAQYYLLNGCRMVWLVYPQKRVIEVLTPDDRDILTEGEMLDGGDVLPGFRVPVKACFERIGVSF